MTLRIDRRILLTAFITLIALTAGANMASPLDAGTWTATPFISKHFDITGEKIQITPDGDFRTAQFKIEYHIKAARSGKQIPLLFYASDFKEHFRIWVDDIEVELSKVPEAYKELEGTPFNDFDYLFKTESWSETKQVMIEESPSGGFYVDIDDLKFFEVDLNEGDHVIRVEYVADVWVDNSHLVKEYSFRYVLSPAKYWKSFGGLEITLDAAGFGKMLTTNLGDPVSGDLQNKAAWIFSSLPVEIIEISYKPDISPTADALIAVSAPGITVILALILVVLHIIGIRKYRKAHRDRQFSWVVIAGGLVVPFLILLGYILAFDLIDYAIGPEASGNHGYSILIMIFYPVILPPYWLLMWLVDRTMARRLGAGA